MRGMDAFAHSLRVREERDGAIAVQAGLHAFQNVLRFGYRFQLAQGPGEATEVKLPRKDRRELRRSRRRSAAHPAIVRPAKIAA